MTYIKDDTQETNQARAKCPNKTNCQVVLIMEEKTSYLYCITCKRKVKP